MAHAAHLIKPPIKYAWKICERLIDTGLDLKTEAAEYFTARDTMDICT